MITGEFRNSLDEKGRILVPAKVRTEIPGNVLVLTQGVDRCLWLFTPDEWQSLSDKLMGATSPFHPKASLLQRRIIAPAQEVEIDKAGRINIPPTLREYAALQKECVILGIKRYLEVWDETEYRTYLERTEEEFKAAAAEMGGIITF